MGSGGQIILWRRDFFIYQKRNIEFQIWIKLKIDIKCISLVEDHVYPLAL